MNFINNIAQEEDMKYFNKKRFSMKQVVFLLSLVIVGIAIFAYASTVTIPNTFTSGTTISSTQMNANFTAVKTAVDDNDSRITTIANAMSAVKSTGNAASHQITGTVSDVLSLTVTPPADGYMIVMANGSVEIDGLTAGAVQAKLFLTTTSGGTSAPEQAWVGNATAGSLSYDLIPYSIVKVFPVTASVSETFYLTGYENAGATNANTYIFPFSLTALFVQGALP